MDISAYHQGLAQWVVDCRNELEERTGRGSYAALAFAIATVSGIEISHDLLRKWEVRKLKQRVSRDKEEAIERYSASIGMPRPEWLPSDGGNSSEWSVEMIHSLSDAEVAAMAAICLQILNDRGYNPFAQKPETRTEFELWLLNNIELAHAVTGIEKPRLIQMSQGEVTLSDFALISCKIFKVDDASWFFRLYPEHQPAKGSPAQGNEKSPNRDKKKKPRQPQA